ncbi:MAG: matrixin family metalloprotease, partial [archaeon]
EQNQLAKNMRYLSNTIKYSIQSNCPDYKKEAVITSLNNIAKNTILKFVNVNDNSANLKISCQDQIEKDTDGTTILGMGKAGEYYTFDDFSVIMTPGTLIIYNVPSDTSGQPVCVLSNTVVHEILHTLGFGHNSDPNSIMYFAASKNSDFCRSGNIDQYIIDILNTAYSIPSLPDIVISQPTITKSDNNLYVGFVLYNNGLVDFNGDIKVMVSIGSKTIETFDLGSRTDFKVGHGFKQGSYVASSKIPSGSEVKLSVITSVKEISLNNNQVSINFN